MQIETDVEFQRRVWIAQRFGWVSFAILIIAALLGLFGSGVISRSAADGSGLSVQYERFGRLLRSTDLQVTLTAPGDTARLELERRYFDSVQIEQIIPIPHAVESRDGWLVYNFIGPSPVSVTFHLRPARFGSVEGTARIPGGDAVRFRQFIYP
jgi:hypothetical protein